MQSLATWSTADPLVTKFRALGHSSVWPRGFSLDQGCG